MLVTATAVEDHPEHAIFLCDKEAPGAFAVSAPEPKNTTLKPFVHKSDVVLAVSTKVLVSVESRPALIQDPRLELMSLQNQRVAPVPE